MAIPSENLPAISQRIWDLKYRLRTGDGAPLEASLADTWARVARAAAASEPRTERARVSREFEAAMRDLAFLPAGRIIAGAGAKRDVTLFNCFVMGTIEDDLGSIFDHVREAALTMQKGGGIGHDFSTLRPSGALVHSIGAGASGPVSFMDVWDAMCRTIMSAGQRRGAMMATLRCDHPDIEAFIDAKADPQRLRNFNLSVLVTDAFLAAVKADADWPLVFGGVTFRTVRARALWDRMMRATYAYAEPGVIFIDRINRQNNLAYCETINATNPCVTADTWIMTADGPRTVAELVGRPFVARVNGKPYASGVAGFFSSGRKPVFRLSTDRGFALKLTADHRVLAVRRRTRWSLETEWTEAAKLNPGDEVVLSDHRLVAAWGGRGTEDEGFLLGLLIGDGHLKDEKAVLSARPPAAAVNSPGEFQSSTMSAAFDAVRRFKHRSDFSGWHRISGSDEWRLASVPLRDLAHSFGISRGNKTISADMERASSSFARGLLRGLFDADGSVQGDHVKGASVRLSQSDSGLLEACQRVLLRLGISSSIYGFRRDAGQKLLPDGRGGLRSYPIKAQHELVIASENLFRFAEIVGFSDDAKQARLKVLVRSLERRPNRERFIARVAEIVPSGEDEVFDVEIPEALCFDANGLVAHNCGEEPLPPYGACLLGSINLARLVPRPFEADAHLDERRLEALVPTAVRLLDNVIDISAYPLPAQRKEAKAKRRIGLGVTGLADALIMCGVPYGSPEAVRLAGRWMGLIERAAYRASAALAEEKGPFPLFDADKFLAAPNVARLPDDVRAAIRAHGIRNGCLTSIAPTGTISLLAGNVSSGVEPVFDFCYRRRIREAGDRVSEETVEDYAHRLYRSKHPTGPLPPAFVTAGELTPRQHLEMQAALQAHVDSAISKTINCPESMAFDAFKEIYTQADGLGLKGCTTFRPNPVTGSVLTREPPADATAAAATHPAEPQFAASAGRAAVPVTVETSPPAATRSRTALVPVGPGPVPGAVGGEVVYMSRPLEREAALSGLTYKLKWAGSDHALYITINDIEQDGRRRPFEIFINTKNLEHYAWTVALTRMISAVFRRGGDVTFVVDELKAIFDPQGGQWMDGRYVPSLLAAIGGIIEQHMRRTGFLGEAVAETGGASDAASAAASRLPGAGPGAANAPLADTDAAATRGSARRCPRCAVGAFVRQDGCWVCLDCGHTKCG